MQLRSIASQVLTPEQDKQEAAMASDVCDKLMPKAKACRSLRNKRETGTHGDITVG